MMINPEVYYEDNLKGKSLEEFKTVIRGLQIEIGKLKAVMEEPTLTTSNFEDIVEQYPDTSTQLWWTREYLKLAKQGLEELGVDYIPSRTELKAIKFQENIANIIEIVFTIGGYFQGHKTYNVQFIEDELVVKLKHFDEEKEILLLDENDEVMDKNCFLGSIEKLYIGEWKRSYSTLDMICDGTQWELEVIYDNGMRTVKCAGDNVYPYNFDELVKIFK